MINEKALVKAMKAAYKGGGVKIWRREWRLQDTLCVCSGYWLVALPMETVPGPALGLAAEWLRAIPPIGRGWLVVKGQEPEPLSEETTPPLEDAWLSNIMDWSTYIDIKPTNMQVNGSAAFQRRDGKIELFDPERIAIVGGISNLGLCCLDGSAALWRDAESDAVVVLHPRRAVPAKELAHLEQFDFWGREDEQ